MKPAIWAAVATVCFLLVGLPSVLVASATGHSVLAFILLNVVLVVGISLTAIVVWLAVRDSR